MDLLAKCKVENRDLELELLEEFLRALCPPEANEPIYDAFLNMKKHPVQLVLQGFSQLSDDIRAHNTNGIANINGILLGIAMCNGCERSSDMREIFKSYNERNRRGRGENVVDFLKARAGKGL